MTEWQVSRTATATPARARSRRHWHRWAPYAAVAWSLAYAGLAGYWAVSGHGFPFADGLVSEITGPLVGRLGPHMAWVVVVAAGIPAAALGIAMVRATRTLRPLLIAAGALLSAVLLLLMTDVTLVSLLGYTPGGLFGLLKGTGMGRSYSEYVVEVRGSVAHQLLCLAGGFFWLAATIRYARRSGDACLYCGRREDAAGWTSPQNAARWGRIATYAALVVPVFYAVTRYAWALGIPLGISEEFLRRGYELGLWVAGLSMAHFGLLGAVLTMGLVQRWGEVFPRWMIGLAGKRVPVALALVPASIVSVLVVVGGVSMWSGYAQVVVQGVSGAASDMGIVGHAPTALFPLWGVSLAVATLGYYYRRRAACEMCGRGAAVEAGHLPVAMAGAS